MWEFFIFCSIVTHTFLSARPCISFHSLSLWIFFSKTCMVSVYSGRYCVVSFSEFDLLFILFVCWLLRMLISIWTRVSRQNNAQPITSQPINSVFQYSTKFHLYDGLIVCIKYLKASGNMWVNGASSVKWIRRQKREWNQTLQDTTERTSYRQICMVYSLRSGQQSVHTA